MNVPEPGVVVTVEPGLADDDGETFGSARTSSSRVACPRY